jgi:hypothetical protein
MLLVYFRIPAFSRRPNLANFELRPGSQFGILMPSPSPISLSVDLSTQERPHGTRLIKTQPSSETILLRLHQTMNPPPRPSLPTESAGKARESQALLEDELPAITGQALQPSLSPIPPSEAASSTRSRSLHADVPIRYPPSTDNLLQLPQSTSPHPANPRSTVSSSPAPPEELIRG